jgi:hypothetical protein
LEQRCCVHVRIRTAELDRHEGRLSHSPRPGRSGALLRRPR